MATVNVRTKAGVSHFRSKGERYDAAGRMMDLTQAEQDELRATGMLVVGFLPSLSSPSEVANTQDEESESLEDYTVEELKAMAKERDISTTGMLRADLIEALEE